MVVGLALVCFAGLVLVGLGWLSLIGRLQRNGFAGIRTPFTMHSDENWAETHRAAAPLLIFGGVAILMAGLAFLPFAVIGRLGDSLLAAVTLALTVVLVADVLIAWQFGVRKAKAALGN